MIVFSRHGTCDHENVLDESCVPEVGHCLLGPPMKHLCFNNIDGEVIAAIKARKDSGHHKVRLRMKAQFHPLLFVVALPKLCVFIKKLMHHEMPNLISQVINPDVTHEEVALGPDDFLRSISMQTVDLRELGFDVPTDPTLSGGKREGDIAIDDLRTFIQVGPVGIRRAVIFLTHRETSHLFLQM